MNIEFFDTRTKHLNVMAEIKIFKFLHKFHKNEKHENKDIYKCEICCEKCDELLIDFLYGEESTKY
jgi:hypothetical protein